MMNEEEYACDKFVGQRWRPDVCKVCFQPKRLHELKKKNITTNKDEKTIVRASTKTLTADTKTTNQTDVLANIRHREHKQQQDEETLQSTVTVSDEKPLIDNNTLVVADNNIDGQVTVGDNLCSDVVVGKHDQEMKQSNNEDDSCDMANGGRNEEDTAESCQTLPDKNSNDIQGANAPSSSNIVASLVGGSVREAMKMGDEGTGSEVAEDAVSFPPPVEELNASHIEELSKKSLPEVTEDEGINKKVTTLSPSLVEDDKVESEIPGETGPEEHTTANQIEDDVLLDNATSSLQVTNIVPSLDTEQPQQLNDDGQLESNVAELPQPNSNVTSSLAANDPTPPTLAAANNPAPPMVIDNQGSNIPIPPPPPPIRVPPPPPTNEPSAGSPPDNEPSTGSPDNDHPAMTLQSPQVSFTCGTGHLFCYITFY